MFHWRRLVRTPGNYAAAAPRLAHTRSPPISSCADSRGKRGCQQAACGWVSLLAGMIEEGESVALLVFSIANLTPESNGLFPSGSPEISSGFESN